MQTPQLEEHHWIDISSQSPLWKTHYQIMESTLKNALEKAIEFFPPLKGKVQVSILLTDNTFIQNLNRDYRKKDKPTNVLSFPFEELEKGTYLPRDETVLLGDIVLAHETIEAESLQKRISFGDHLVHLVVHGFLHLLGFDHEIGEDDAVEMEELEIKILKTLHIANPYEAGDGLCL
jgi:probable rRNA maturation factor